MCIFFPLFCNETSLIMKIVVSGNNSVIFCFFSDIDAIIYFVRTYFLVSYHSRTSPLVRAPLQLTCLPSFTTCAVDDFLRLIFGNRRSPDKFTGKHKRVSHPTSSQESLKHRSTFKFTLRTIYEVNGTARYLI